MTPMAANFNIVPAALLELKNQYGVIKAQVPTAIPLLIANILILYFAGVPPVKLDAALASRMARHRARPCHPGISAQARPCAGRRRGRAAAARASPDLLRQLRLAQLRPRLVDPADLAAAVSRHSGSRGDRRARRRAASRRKRSRPSSPISIGRSSRGFERPYGWAWLLYLHLEATRHADGWGGELEPLARAFAAALRRLSADADLSDPRRHAFQHQLRASVLVARMGRRVRSGAWPSSSATARSHWFGDDRDCQAWEPGGDEFLSSALIEAVCMARAAARALSRSGSGNSCRAWPSGSRRPCSRRRRQRPQRRQDRASRRPEPQPRLVLARDRRCRCDEPRALRR